MVVHVDDFMCTGERIGVDWLENKVKQKFELTTETLGGEKGESKEVSFLGRRIRWKENGIEIEGDPKHAEILIKEWGLERGTKVETPVMKTEVREDEEVILFTPALIWLTKILVNSNYNSSRRIHKELWFNQN